MKFTMPVRLTITLHLPLPKDEKGRKEVIRNVSRQINSMLGTKVTGFHYETAFNTRVTQELVTHYLDQHLVIHKSKSKSRCICSYDGKLTSADCPVHKSQRK